MALVVRLAVVRPIRGTVVVLLVVGGNRHSVVGDSVLGCHGMFSQLGVVRTVVPMSFLPGRLVRLPLVVVRIHLDPAWSQGRTVVLLVEVVLLLSVVLPVVRVCERVEFVT